MEPRERVLAALGHQEPDRIPIDLGGPANSISKQIAETLLKRLQLPEQRISVWNPVQQLVDIPEPLLQKLNVDTRHIHAIPPIPTQTESSSYYVDWLGLRYHQRGTIFSIESPPLAAVQTPNDVDKFTWPKPKESWFTPAIALAQSYSREGYAVIADPSCPGIFELGCWLMGWPRFLSVLLQNPELATYLMDQVLHFNISFWEKFLSMAGDHVQIAIIGDDYGMESGPFMAPSIFQRIIQPRLSRLVKAIKRAAKVSVLLHSCGAIKALIPSLIKANIDVLSPIQPTAHNMSAKGLKSQFGEHLIFHGGIDLHQLKTKPIPKALQSLNEQLRILGTSGGYIFGLTHTVMDLSQIEYFLAIKKAVVRFRP